MTDPVSLSIRQFVETWRLFCLPVPGHEIARTSGTEYLFTGLPIPFFNVAVLTGTDVDSAALRSEAAEARRWAAPKNVPWMFLVTHERLAQPESAEADAEGCGLVPVMRMTGMIADKVDPLTQPPNDLELTVPIDDPSCAALLDINSAAYGMPLDAAQEPFGTRSFWKDHTAVIGKNGGEPVSCTAVLLVDGYRYVALVATAPGRQRRGYAGATMRRALELAGQRYGECPTVLHATDAGRPVYERMGYRPISTHTLFMEHA